MELRKDYLNETIETIYLGGGTPSQLSAKQLRRLFSSLEQVFGPRFSHHGMEVTIECNPDDVNAGFARQLHDMPVNRVSMGAQTFDDRRLHFLHRRHTAQQATEAIELLRDAGISNISIDLMYGFPNETLADWQNDIEQAIRLNVEHISAYSLMYEEGTPLFQMLEGGIVSEIDEELSILMYSTLIERLAEAGYEHYEISNFAKKGHRSRHNSNYWNGTPYLGLGAAAHSYDQSSRQWNVDHLADYLAGMACGHPKTEREVLSDDTRYNDTVMTALRTCEGMDTQLLSPHYAQYCLAQAARFIDDGLLSLSNGRLKLTRRGLFVSNMIMSELMKA
jgi:oxygen-independent coproporphyrinogen-3 oxidase